MTESEDILVPWKMPTPSEISKTAILVVTRDILPPIQKDISILHEEMEELKRVNALLIERLTMAMDKITDLEEKQSGYSEPPYRTHWEWLWTTKK